MYIDKDTKRLLMNSAEGGINIYMINSRNFKINNHYRFHFIHIENMYYIRIKNKEYLKNIRNIIVDFQKDIECQFSISNDLPGEEY